jgi:hypothetical protein
MLARVRYRRHTARNFLAGELLQLDRHPTARGRWVAEVVVTKTGYLRSLDTANYRIDVAQGGRWIDLATWASKPRTLFDRRVS